METKAEKLRKIYDLNRKDLDNVIRMADKESIYCYSGEMDGEWEFYTLWEFQDGSRLKFDYLDGDFCSF